MFPRLSFNYDTVNYIANNGDFSDCKTLALGMKGLMEMVGMKQPTKASVRFQMELQHQKFTPKKPSESTVQSIMPFLRLHLYISGRNPRYSRPVFVLDSRTCGSGVSQWHRWICRAQCCVILNCTILEFISLNRVFASVTAQSGTLRSVVQCLANAWISEVFIKTHTFLT